MNAGDVVSISRKIPVIQEVWVESDWNNTPCKNEKVEVIADSASKFCRICAAEGDNTISIFGEKGKKLKLAAKINKHLPITVSVGDKLPTSVCEKCISKIEITIDLINSCIKAQLQLAEMLISKGKQQTTLLACQHEGNREEHYESIEKITVGTMYSNGGFDSAPKTNENVNVNKTIKVEEDVRNYVDSGKIHQINTVAVIENPEISKKKRTKELGLKVLSKEIPKKPKFKVVVVKVKNNGGIPNHKQIAQTLRELKLDLEKNTTEKNTKEPPKEGHVVILDKTVKLTGEKRNENRRISSPHLQIKINSVNEATPETENSSDSVDPPSSADHSYTHWNQKHMKCNYCTETFVGRINLISHQMMAHPENVFCCFKCDQVFYDCKEDYVKHIEAHCITSINRAKKVQSAEENEMPLDDGSGNSELKVTAVARVSVDDGERLEGVDASDPNCEPMSEAKSGLRMKLSKEFEGMDPNLKNKIVGTIQKLVRRNRIPPTDRNIYCMLCKVRFSSPAALEAHQRIKHDEKLPCRFCPQLCQSEAALKKHESRFHMKEFKCHFCSEIFKSRGSLRKHELNHIGEKPFKCDVCGKSYTSRGSLQIHFTTHSSEKPYLCDKCGKGFKHVSNLNAHRRTHSNDPSVVKAHRCSICSKAFRCQFLVREHMRMHTGDKPFVCEQCGKSFYKKQQLRQHSAVHAVAPLYKCGVCGARFNRKGNMMQHQKRHGKEGVFTCRICGETFSSIGLVLRHRRTHGEEGVVGARSGDEQDPELAMAFKCDVCGKLLSSKVSLTLHMRTHTGERPYVCSLCGKSFSQSTSLKVHKRTHTGERPFSCSQCSRAFSSRAALTVHERGHTGERPYPCKLCGKSFRCSAALKQHHTTHSDNRPYPCEFCGKRFRRKEALDIHLRTHTGERPYSCKICGRRFAQKGDANKHERTHEKVRRISSTSQIELMDECSDSFENPQPLSLVEITTDSESVTEQSVTPMHTSLHLEHGVEEDPYPNLPPGTIIINTQDLMTSSSEITVVTEEDLNNHILGNGIAIHYEEC